MRTEIVGGDAMSYEVLWKHCPQREQHGRGGSKELGECSVCSPFRPAVDQARRDGMEVAYRLILRNPMAAASVLRSMLDGKPPEDAHGP